MDQFCGGFDVLYPRLVVINYDGSVISDNGIIEIVSNGDSCLTKWQMKRKADPIEVNGEEEEIVIVEKVKEKKKVGSTKNYGGVSIELPF